SPVHLLPMSPVYTGRRKRGERRNQTVASSEFRVLNPGFGLETRNPKLETDSHLPFHTGGRFSTNARGPSLASSVCITMLWRSDSNRSPCSKVISLPL